MTSAPTKGSRTAGPITSDVSRESVAKYVKDMPIKIESMKNQCNSQDYSALQISARQLKESARAYGFEQIIPSAEKLEKIAKFGQPTEQVRKVLDELVGVWQRIQGDE